MGRLILLCLLFLGSAAHASEERWVVYYNDERPGEDFEKYDLVVFDSTNHPSLRALVNRNQRVLGYLSLGEAESYRKDFESLKKKGLLLEENPHWEGHYIIDVRNPEWIRIIIEDRIPALLHKGFNGVMLDTIDSPLYLQERDPQRFPEMREASAALVKEIRLHYPNLFIMLNRGFEILPQVAPHINAVMAESILVDNVTDKENPVFFQDETHQKMVRELKEAQQLNPRLKVYALEYWPLEDAAGVKELYARHRKLGFLPYVSRPDLQEIYDEPK